MRSKLILSFVLACGVECVALLFLEMDKQKTLSSTL